MAKRYYWLKLKDDFFTSKQIKKLRRLAGGDTYVIIFLRLQQLAMKNDGVLEYSGIEESFADELALELDEAPENIMATLNFLASCGWIEQTNEAQYFLPSVLENTGSETASAQRVREHRARKALELQGFTDFKQIPCATSESQSNAKALQCNISETERKRKKKEIEKEKDTETEEEQMQKRQEMCAKAIDSLFKNLP